MGFDVFIEEKSRVHRWRSKIFTIRKSRRVKGKNIYITELGDDSTDLRYRYFIY